MIDLISTSLWFLFGAIVLVTCGIYLGVEITTRKLSREHLENLRKHREESIRDKIAAIAQIRRESDPGGHWSNEVKKLKKENANLHLINHLLTTRVQQHEIATSQNSASAETRIESHINNEPERTVEIREENYSWPRHVFTNDSGERQADQETLNNNQ